MKYINKFNSINEALISTVYSPNVSLVSGSSNPDGLVYTNIGDNVKIQFAAGVGAANFVISYDPLTTPLTFVAAESDSTVMVAGLPERGGTPGNVSLYNWETSTDGITWSAYTAKTTITLTNVGDKVMFRGEQLNRGQLSTSQFRFYMAGKILAYGNLASILDPTMNIDAPGYMDLAGRFTDCVSLLTPPDIPLLASSSLDTDKDISFSSLFAGCTSLQKLPTNIKIISYSMFFGNSNINPIIIPDTVEYISSSAFRGIWQQESNVNIINHSQIIEGYPWGLQTYTYKVGDYLCDSNYNIIFCTNLQDEQTIQNPIAGINADIRNIGDSLGSWSGTLVINTTQVVTLSNLSYVYKKSKFQTQAFTNIYVPDDLVDSYKAAENWSQLPSGYIKPLSEYTNANGPVGGGSDELVP